MGRFQYENLFSMFIHCCEVGGKRGWHERGGGALSVVLDADTLAQIQSGLDFSKPFLPLEKKVENMGRGFILVTGSEQTLEDAPRYPEDICGVVQVSPDGSAYRTVMGFESGVGPTQDLGMHLMIHSALSHRNGKRRSIVYHCHPANLTALSYLLPLEEEAFSKTLWRSGVQCREAFPRGIGIIDRLERDPVKLGESCAEKLKKRDGVLLAFHGLVLHSCSLMDTVGKAEAVEKAAEIRLKLLQVPGGILQEPDLD